MCALVTGVQTCALPISLMWVEEIAVAGPHMAARRGATAALQHELPGHELAVIFAHRAFGGAETGMGAIGAARPFPHVAVHLRQREIGRASGRERVGQYV